MKLLSILACLVFGIHLARAYEADGRLPSKSIESTVVHVTTLKRPTINYPDGLLLEVLAFIPSGFCVEEMGVKIDASRLNLPKDKRVKIVAKDITILQAAGIIAEQLNADILIQPGKIALVPRSSEAKKEP